MKLISKVFEIAGMMFAGAVVYEYMRQTVEHGIEDEE